MFKIVSLLGLAENFLFLFLLFFLKSYHRQNATNFLLILTTLVRISAKYIFRLEPVVLFKRQQKHHK